MMLDSPHTSVPMLMRGNTPPTTRSPPHRSRTTGNPPIATSQCCRSVALTSRESSCLPLLHPLGPRTERHALLQPGPQQFVNPPRRRLHSPFIILSGVRRRPPGALAQYRVEQPPPGPHSTYLSLRLASSSPSSHLCMSFSGRDRLCSPSDSTDMLKASGPRASAIVCVCVPVSPCR